MRTRGPAARRSVFAMTVTFFLITGIADVTHPTGSGWEAHLVTSLPPTDTVTSATLPRWARRNPVAAASWVRSGYACPPGPRASGAHPFAETREVVVAPPQPKLTSFSRWPRGAANLGTW